MLKRIKEPVNRGGIGFNVEALAVSGWLRLDGKDIYAEAAQTPKESPQEETDYAARVQGPPLK